MKYIYVSQNIYLEYKKTFLKTTSYVINFYRVLIFEEMISINTIKMYPYIVEIFICKSPIINILTY